jgi:hypothetical protein
MPADLANCYPEPVQLPGGHLKQGFDLRGPTPKDAVLAYCHNASPARRAAARADIARLLRDRADGPDAALDALDADRAQGPDMPARDHLPWIDRLLADALAAEHGHAE